MKFIKSHKCRECGNIVIEVFDNKHQFIKYGKMCPCLEKIMELRKQKSKPIKRKGSAFIIKRNMEL